MIEKQKELLAQIKAAQETAQGLLAKGVKIEPVFRRLREGASEIETRLRYLEKHAPAAKPAARKPKNQAAE